MTVLSLTDAPLSWESQSPEETLRLGEALGGSLVPGDVVALFGELGSGKTVLVRGIAGGLGCRAEEVHSPSFTLVNEYLCPTAVGSGGQKRPGRLAHVDLYRLVSEEELPGIGWDHYLRACYVVTVEWAERALAWLPKDHLRVGLESLGAARRRFRVQGTGPRSAAILRRWIEVAAPSLQVG